MPNQLQYSTNKRATQICDRALLKLKNMKAIQFLLIFLITSCAANPPQGHWQVNDRHGRFEFSVTSSDKCWWVSAGELDGIGSECIMESKGDNRFKIYFVNPDESIDNQSYFYVLFKTKSKLELNIGGNKLVLNKSN